jgi:transcriptional regulator with XRE-family HTH domain
MADKQTFGERLKHLREKAGLTQQELADGAGMHRFGVAKLERDEYGPSWATVQALAKALNVNCLAFEGTVEPSGEKPVRPKGRPKKPASGEAPVAEEVVKAEDTRPKKGKRKGG